MAGAGLQRRRSLEPAKSRPNLRHRNARLCDGAGAGRQTRYRRVAYEQNGVEKQAAAGREVLLSAGAVQSPQILELSGIGREDVLGDQGIPVKHRLMGVGENYRDHLLVRMVWRVKGIRTLNEETRGLSLAGQGAEICVHP